MIVNVRRPRPRRLQFGLGAMLALIPLLAIWLAYEAHWIRQWHMFLTSSQLELGEYGFFHSTSGGPVEPSAPGALGMFGERGIGQINF